jgi:hypothetical protein
MQFKAGDVVKIKGQSQFTLTVEVGNSPGPSPTCVCIWFAADGRLMRDTIHVEALEATTPSSPEPSTGSTHGHAAHGHGKKD